VTLFGPQHDAKADELLTEIEAVSTLADETETALSVRAAAHAILPAAARLRLGQLRPGRPGMA